MNPLPLLDIIVLIAYLTGVVGFGCWFVRKSGNTSEFTAAGGALPGWAVGLSIFGTFLSSNTFLGVPGSAFGSNWNAFVFSLSLPVAAWIAVKFFVPFYRRTGEISAYHHFERRFGGWARTYAVICYLLTQIARMGSIMFGVSLALNALTGWNIAGIIVVSGIIITLYTVLGGIEAVIWTDVVQSILLSAGAIVVVLILLFDMPGGPSALIHDANQAGKFSLGSPQFDLTSSTIWLVLLYGLFMNLNNFGIDQSFVQRYHTARTPEAAGRSVWLGALLYVPISLMFFFIGSGLFAYYHAQPEMLHDIKVAVATEGLVSQEVIAGAADIEQAAAKLTDKDIGDKVFPHFIVHRLPVGITGLLIAAIFAAAMSSIDTSLNSSATVILCDLYRRYVRPDATEKQSMRVLYSGTVVMGIIGTSVALAMIGVKSVLEAWWMLSGIFAGGMLGLFLLGMVTRVTHHAAAALAVIAGLLVITWMTLSTKMELPENLQNPLHGHMVIVIGTLTIFFVGLLLNKVFRASPVDATTKK